ncbi:MAG TPA: PaaX family transcriptional regulator C-terminal domain-containing protein [Solimonas sp.]|nr:PaaX family transcriptional regulator C-terminal domain-containing protein [Solimonas sp.]
MPAANPRRFLLKLLFAAEGQSLTAREMLAAGEVLGFSSNSLRVALVRLTRDGLIASPARGVYGLGPEAAALAEDASHWRSGEQRVRPWSGDWILVHTGALARTDRTALRRRARALELLGLREYTRGLYLRPDNLAGGVGAVRARLRQLGLEPGALVILARDFAPGELERVHRLWNGRALSRQYERMRQQLETWLQRAGELELPVAAREAYRAGDQAIRTLIYDPLLPEPLVDVAQRAAFTDTVLRFDDAGHRIWRRLGLQDPPPAMAPRRRDRSRSRPH